MKKSDVLGFLTAMSGSGSVRSVVIEVRSLKSFGKMADKLRRERARENRFNFLMCLGAYR